ncbi:glycosyltransferase family 2 protein [Flavisolibacter ginsenosidimutans]|uniref:Glycosyltransferase family 2 protein n=1 Tax=Flavisolibacter ginsenosidimutans TaxID=661481 RepID=A0A5B8UF76_9BACT|nr:glycosyltransferase family 2 protein [Flavisolibacter ginsenosidimutans]QEC54760.1 glycosyltransferase family 2 protein [Flavisolibacter ginsenosidimutans]
MNPLVSICIPTYKQTFLLKENLDSVCAQLYQNIEVLVSDDTPDDAVKSLVETYADRLPLSYFKNSPSLGSPANWNAVLQKAKGEFVLLLHHDDQFARPDSLALLLKPFRINPAVDFSFGRNESIENLAKGKAFPWSYFNRYYRDPSLLIARNTLGAPSNVLLRRQVVQLYDERFKWIVDVECYYRLFKGGKKFAYTDQDLIKTGRHEGQITNECLNDSSIVLYENLTFAIEKIRKPKSIVVFDFYWRLLRNNNVRSVDDITVIGIEEARLPRFIRTIIKAQSKVPVTLLRKGFVSKMLMAATYAFL